MEFEGSSMPELLSSDASNSCAEVPDSGDLCDVKTWERTFGDKSSRDDPFSEGLCIQYTNANRICSIQILQNSHGGCVDEVLVKLLDHDDHDPNNTQADMVTSTDGKNADISCQVTRFSGNIVRREHNSRDFFTYSNSHGHGAFSHRRSSSSIPIAIVEHSCINKEGDRWIYLKVETQRMQEGSLSVNVEGPVERKVLRTIEGQKLIRGRRIGRSGCPPLGWNLTVVAPVLSFSNGRSNGHDTSAVVSSSGTNVGDGNGSIFYDCLFGTFE